ncbi:MULTISPECIES: MFS transporter [Bradyrhizobium]|uniref:MFS transporter n=1 Tax=Bradyrhizobium elkanii TaxID=29448 RepID=UPI00041F7C9D
MPLAALTLVAGALGDRFGQTRIFFGGIALYGLGAIAIGFAPSFVPLIVGRFLQGLGEAVILPMAFPSLGRSFPPTRKPVRSASNRRSCYTSSPSVPRREATVGRRNSMVQ